MSRLAEVDEIIVATNPSVEERRLLSIFKGYAAHLALKSVESRVVSLWDRILSMQIRVTLARAFEGRREIYVAQSDSSACSPFPPVLG